MCWTMRRRNPCRWEKVELDYCNTALDGGTTPQLDTAFQFLCEGNYIVTMQDQNGCQDTAHVELTVPTPMTLTVGVQDPSCFGMSDGMINSIPGGGIQPYSYIWSNGAPNSPINNNVASGTYDLVVEDANGCTIDSLGIVVGRTSCSDYQLCYSD